MITNAILSHTPTANAPCTPWVHPKEADVILSIFTRRLQMVHPGSVHLHTPHQELFDLMQCTLGVSCQVLMLQSATKTTQQYNATDVGGCMAAKTCGFPSHSLLVDSNCMFSHCCSYYLVIGVILNVISVP